MAGLFGSGIDLFGRQGLFGQAGGQQQPQPGMFGGMTQGNGTQVNPALTGQMPPGFDPQQMQQQMPQQAPRNPGFNEPGGWGDRLETIGAILRDNPEIYSQLMARQQADRHAAQQQEAAQQQAQAQDQQWYQHEDYKQQHPDPAPPSPEQRLYDWASQLPPEQRQQAAGLLDQFRPKVIGDPVSGYQFMPRPGGTLGGAYPTAPVGKLTPIPEGGQTPPASGTFP